MKIDATKLRAFVKSHGLTNTNVAAQAGITRQALQTMLRMSHVVEVRESTVKGLARALRLPDASLLSPDPLVGYKSAVAEEHAKLTFHGLGLPTTEPRLMDDLYVPIPVVGIPNQERGHDCQLAAAETEDAPIAGRDKLTVAQCLALHRRVLIRGEPGSGKTTALRHAARAYALGLVTQGNSLKQPQVPLMVRLADFAKARERDADMTLVRFVVTRTLRNASPEYWAQVERNMELELENGTCLVLLDGLDEVGSVTDLVTVLRKFVDDYNRNQFVLTSRIIGLDDAPWRELGFARFEVAPWREEIREFARRWYAGRRPAPRRKQPKNQLDQKADEFATLILSQPSLCEIASNPLMLTILAALHHANATLPRRRVDLYGKIVEVMLETWEASKREARPGDPLHGIVLDAREFGWLLARLALGMQREGRFLRPRWWVNDVVEQFLRDQIALESDRLREQSERVIHYLCERTGLFVERGDGIFGFWHRAFQEYFAARGLLLEADGGSDIVASLRPYIFHPQWEEVVVHVAASLSAPLSTALLRVILDDPDPAGRFLRRSQRLALRCLVDGAAVADRVVLEQLFSGGEAIGRSRWLGTAIVFIGLLKRLLLTRHEAGAQRMLSEIEEAAERHLPDDDYATVYLLTQDAPDPPQDGGVSIHKKRLGRRDVEMVWTAPRKRMDDPEAWHAEVLKLVRDPKVHVKHRIALISSLAVEADSNDKVRHALKNLLVRDRSPTIRAECAEALGYAVSAHSTIVKLLLARLDKERSDLVRERCAEALHTVAPGKPEVRRRLEELLSSASGRVRAGAARGLSLLDFAAPEQQTLLEKFLATISAPAEPGDVRRACIWAVAPLLGRDDQAAVNCVMDKCLEDHDPLVSRSALHVLADAIAEGRREWSQPLVEKIETKLMALTVPCPHFYGDLVNIVAMKEIHGGRRLERLLGDALGSLGDAISIAFVFGSIARDEQIQNSDVDLMVIGGARLKEVAATLHTPEQILGRTVSPVLFSAERFRDQYREGNPFLLDIVRKEKVFLKGTRDELTTLVADRSPD
jgi:predicted nucleotidyltransferase/HEAT repeat protein/transcriptional regulator with XRE-family HTH domain